MRSKINLLTIFAVLLFSISLISANDFLTPLISVGFSFSTIDPYGDNSGVGYPIDFGIFNRHQYYGIKYTKYNEYDFWHGTYKENNTHIFDLIYGFGDIAEFGYATIVSGISFINADTKDVNEISLGIPMELYGGIKLKNIGVGFRFFGYITRYKYFYGFGPTIVINPTVY